MNSDIGSIVRQSFAPFVDRHGLTQLGEVSDGETYSIEYASDVFVVRLGEYHEELYAWLRKAGDVDKQIDLFNFIAFLTDRSPNAPVSNYFPSEPDLAQRYRRQIAHIASALEAYLAAITGFFRDGDYAARHAEVQEFMLRNYPELFKRW